MWVVFPVQSGSDNNFTSDPINHTPDNIHTDHVDTDARCAVYSCPRRLANDDFLDNDTTCTTFLLVDPPSWVLPDGRWR